MRTVFHLGILISVAVVCSSAETLAGENWPMWRGNASRSAAVANSLPTSFELRWVRNFGAREQVWDDPLNLDLMTYDQVFEPIVVDGLLCVGFNDQDKLLALDALTGEIKWTYYAEAPVRLPPVGGNGLIYVCSDDGCLYCVNATNGELKWKFQGAPNSQHAIGNSRLTSAWPARGGPVLYDDSVYFAASIWPFMGTFIYALDANTGAVQWINDNTGAQYIKQPHSAPSFAGVAPQGAFVATEELLIVPGGRSVPAVFDRLTGELKYFEINQGGKGTGGSFVTADKYHYYVHTREKGTRAFNLATGKKTAFMPNEPVLSGDYLYSAEVADNQPVIRAYRVDDESNIARKPIWEIAAPGRGDLVLVNDHLVAAERQQVTVIQIPSEKNKLQEPKILTSTELEGLGDEAISRVLVASKCLYVVGNEGTIASYGEANSAASPNSFVSETTPVVAEPTSLAKDLLSHCNSEGYAFWYGRADSRDLLSLATHSPFVQLAVVDNDAERIQQLRRRLDELGLLGQVTAHLSDAISFRAPKYVAHTCFVASEVGQSNSNLNAIYESVRPYGGKLIILPSETASPDEMLTRVNELNLEQAKCRLVELASASSVVVERVGALPGSADWTHQYGNIANTVKSNDSRVKLPLGILWFGGSSNMDVLPRHGHGPPEQVVGGRLFIEGMNCLSARDVYTGRVLWKREFEDLGTFDVYYDSTYENTPLNPQYNQVHIPGANGRGTNYVVTEECVYLVVGASCLLIDPATGEDVGKLELPLNDDGTQSEWGFLGVYEDVLIGGFGFANYREKMQLEFPSDAGLKRSRQGFGSKSFDRAASRGLIGFNRHSGKELWRVNAKHSFWHNGIVAGGGRVYCLDKNPTQIEEAMKRRGLELPKTYRIICFDPSSGETNWEVSESIFGTWLGYSEKHDLLLQAGAQASDRLYAEVGQGMRVYQAESGNIHWKKDDLKYSGPCILHNDLIITNSNSYSESAGAFYLTDGRQKMVKHPVTGQITPWKMTRAYGCNNIIASENLLTFRSGAAGYYDLNTNSGTGNLGGFKTGCTSNLVVANGVLNAPDYTRTCSCSYQNQTSLALVHMPEVEIWSVNSLASAKSASPQSNSMKDVNSLDAVGFNFGAAGDRHDQDGVLWLEFPAKAGPSPDFLDVSFNSDAKPYSHHSAARSGDPLGWISASGIDHLTMLSIKFGTDETKLNENQALYDLELIFASPRGDTEPRVFDIYAQDNLLKSDVTVGAEQEELGQKTALSVVLRDINIQDVLELRFEAKRGSPLLCGAKVSRANRRSQ